jgi:glycosyltransferase involved in cell wall biosynthesis
MKVSIATICVNQAAFVGEAIESVLAQRHKDVEYIVVDAGSTDGSRDVIEYYCHRIQHVIFEPDDGPADGLNKALRAASGEVWACVNADDLLLPNAAESAVARFEVEPSADVIYGDGLIVHSQRRILRHESSDLFSPLRYAYGVGIVVHPATFIKRASVVAVGGYNASNRTCWDGELLLDLALSGSHMLHVPEPLAMFRLHSDSITGSQRLAAHHDLEHKRLFQRARGREWKKADRAVSAAARVLKAARHPKMSGNPRIRIAQSRIRAGRYLDV